MALFEVDQRVVVVDRDSPYHALFGKVIVVTRGHDRFFYWVRFYLKPAGNLFGEEQLQAA